MLFGIIGSAADRAAARDGAGRRRRQRSGSGYWLSPTAREAAGVWWGPGNHHQQIVDRDLLDARLRIFHRRHVGEPVRRERDGWMARRGSADQNQWTIGHLPVALDARHRQEQRRITLERGRQVTLRPGESRPLDFGARGGRSKNVDNRPCDVRAASLRVTLDFPDVDRRLIGANLWLIDACRTARSRSQLHRCGEFRTAPSRSISTASPTARNGSTFSAS